VNQTFTGRAVYRCDVEAASGKLLIAVRCTVGDGRDEDIALLDTATPWCLLPPDVALDLGYVPAAEGDTRLHTRFGLLVGELLRLPMTFVADEGETTTIEATWFLSPDWPGPVVIGWKGCLERIRFAFDPREDSIFFAEY
jgi:hypothetical protein